MLSPQRQTADRWPSSEAWSDAAVSLASGLSPLERAAVTAVAYADVFDFPLTTREVHRYLVGVAASAPAFEAELGRWGFGGGCLSRTHGLFTLAGRERLVEDRRRRAWIAARLWPDALRYGAILARLPFVRLVAVSGALAVDNVEADADIDYFIVTEPGRLWLCRAAVIAVVRLAARRGVTLCPNYFLSERALALTERDLFTAHELAQMVPLAGLATYDRTRGANGWTATFLPNATGAPRALGPTDRRGGGGQQLAESIGRTPPGAWIERWEMRRKVRKFRRRSHADTEASFSTDWCKGHFEGHGRRVMAAFADRLRALELDR